jgi:hypothetical protein
MTTGIATWFLSWFRKSAPIDQAAGVALYVEGEISIEQHGNGFTAHMSTGLDATGNPTARSWSFSCAEDLAKQVGELGGAADDPAVKAAIAAALEPAPLDAVVL